jgi:hypothetical protein
VLARLVFGIAAAPLGSGIPQGRQRRAVGRVFFAANRASGLVTDVPQERRSV